MKRDEQAVVSLETHRRRRLAESRKKKPVARPARGGGGAHEPMINWRRAPLALGAVAIFLALSWLVNHLHF